jgi:predicted RNA-binding protein YlxR (DUF448 family)
VPKRTCAACRERRHTRALIHLICVDGQIVLGPQTKGAARVGRGAWVCAQADCLVPSLTHANRLSRAFKQKVALDPDLYSSVRAFEWETVVHWWSVCRRQGLLKTRPAPLDSPPPQLLLCVSPMEPSQVKLEKANWPAAASVEMIAFNPPEKNQQTTLQPGLFALYSGRASNRLRQHLRRWVDMG